VDERERLALRILRDALDAGPGQREAFLSQRCGGDGALRARVDSLLDGIDEAELDAATFSIGPDQADIDPLIGARLGPFLVIERIGKGGMGVVYRGIRESTDFVQEVALKLIRRGFDFDDIRARFLRERRILARLDHPNLARFIDGGVADDGRPWFALEFVRGEPITRWCDTRMLDLRSRVRRFLDVCAAVQYAHAQLVVHRDLKPGNILVDERGHVRLLDFGIARLLGDEEAESTLTRAGHRGVLTPEYAAPEQYAGEAAGVATDVYALGVIAYELTTGALPYELDRSDLASTERTIRERPAQPPLQAIARDGADALQARLRARDTSLHGYRRIVRGDLSRILDKALAKEPARRYASAQAFADDLARWLDGTPVRVSGDAFGYRLRKFVGRNRVAVGFAVLAALAVGAGMAATVWQMREARVQRDAAEASARRAEAVRDYVMLLFRDAAEKRAGSDQTAREMLRNGAAKAVAHLEETGEEGLSTVLALAELYATMDDMEGSLALLDRILASPLLADVPDVQARARFLKSDIEFSRGQLAQARTLLDQAQAWWRLAPARYRRELATSRLIQGRIERGEGRFEDSVATLAAGIAEYRALAGPPDSSVGQMQVSLSISLARLQRAEEGLQAAEAAYRTYEAIGEQNSGYGLGALTNRGQFRQMTGDPDGALADLRLAAKTRRSLFGPSSELAKTDSAIASILVERKQYDEAIALFEAARPMAIEFGGRNARVAADIQRKLATTYLFAGRAGDALATVDELRDDGARHGADSLERGMAHLIRARALHALDRDEESLRDLASAERSFRSAGKAGEKPLAEAAELRRALPQDAAAAPET